MATQTLTLAEEAAQAAQRAAELRAQVEAERAAERERQADERARRAAVARQWWREHSATFTDRWRGRLAEAWSAFETSVRTGEGSPAHLFIEYRRLAVEMADDRAAVARALYAEEEGNRQRIAKEITALADKGIGLLGVTGPARAEFNAEAAALLGVDIPDDQDTDTTVTQLAQAAPKPHGVPHPSAILTTRGPHSYAEAVDKVAARVEREAREQARADRDTARDAYIDAHLRER